VGDGGEGWRRCEEGNEVKKVDGKEGLMVNNNKFPYRSIARYIPTLAGAWN